MTVSRLEIEKILRAKKNVAPSGKFRQKAHPDYQELIAEVTCLEFPQFNLLYRCVYHCSRKPRKISHLLTADKQRIFALDINPGGSHRNLISLESVNGTHWQIGPEMEAEFDERDRTPTQWHHAFAVKAGLEFSNYREPVFEEPGYGMDDLFGDQDE